MVHSNTIYHDIKDAQLTDSATQTITPNIPTGHLMLAMCITICRPAFAITGLENFCRFIREQIH
jgi:hypothetical protein